MLDTSTLHIAHIATSLVITIFAWAIVWPHDSIRGARQWVFGFTLILPALLLFLLRGRTSDFLSIVVANTLLIVSSCISMNGILLFTGYSGVSRRQAVFLGLLVLAFAGSLYWFTAVENIAKPRALLAHGFLAVNSMIIAIAVYTSRLRGIGRPMFILAYGYYFLVSVARIILICQSNSSSVWSNSNHEFYLLSSIASVTAMVIGFSLMVTDILRTQVQQQRDELESNLRRRETLEAMIHHDLHGPLTPILYRSRKLLMDETLSETARTDLDDIVTSAERIESSIDYLLQLHQVENQKLPLKLVAVDVNTLLEKLENELRILARPHGIRINIYPGNSAGTRFRIDEDVMLRALVNLAQNAVEASPARGTVTVSADTREDSVLFSIHNQGEVPEAIQSRLFEKYVSCNKSSGKGLGAYSARLAAEAHGGSVSLDASTPGETVITVRMPALLEPRQSAS